MTLIRSYTIAVVPGDGIGVEVVRAGLKLLRLAGQRYGFTVNTCDYDLGAERYLRTGEVLPESVLIELRQCDAILFGAMGRPDVEPGILEQGFILRLRREFNQYVNLRPVRSMVTDRESNTAESVVDLVLVRENLEGLYGGAGGVSYLGTAAEVAVQESINTYFGVDRIVDYAFNVAKSRRRKVTVCHKSNVLTYAGSLWTRVARRVGDRYPDVMHEYVNVDAACLHLVAHPGRYDVIVTDSMFGDILSDLTAGLAGGLGFAGSGNLDPTREYPSMFEPIHGSAPDIAGKGLANPIGAFVAVEMLLQHIGEESAANAVSDAVSTAVAQMRYSKRLQIAGTDEISEAVCACLE